MREASNVEREKQLSETELCTNSGNRYWVLTQINEQEDVICACETTKKKMFVGGKDGYREVTGYAIAGVYTKPEYRGQRMAALLLAHMKTWLDLKGRAECCSLYSDVGPVCSI
jgi:GNAT superfamily N-acetyltransferase